MAVLTAALTAAFTAAMAHANVCVVSMRKRPVEPAHSVMPGALVCLSFLRRCDRMKAIGAHRAHKSSRAPCVAERRGAVDLARGGRAIKHRRVFEHKVGP